MSTKKNNSGRLAVQLAVAAALVSAAGYARAAQTWWDAGAGTAYLDGSFNWGPVNSNPGATGEGILDTTHTPVDYTYPDVMFFAGPGRAQTSPPFSQAIGALTFDMPDKSVVLYSTPDNINGRAGFSGNTGSPYILSLGANFGLNSAQSVTIADSATYGTTLLGLDLVTAGGEAGVNVTNPDATLIINSIVRNKLASAAEIHGIEKTGAGKLVLGAVNQFGGSNATLGAMLVKISGGTLSVSNNANLGHASNKIVLNGGVLQYGTTTTGNVTFSRAVDVAADSGIDLSLPGTNYFMVSGSLTGSATLSKSGTSELYINGTANTFNGTLAVETGSVRLLTPTALAAGAVVKLVGNNTTLNLRKDGGGDFSHVDMDVTTRNGQLYVDRNGTTGGLFRVGDVTLGEVALNLNGNAANGNSIEVGNVTLTGNGVLQASAINTTVTGAVGESGGSYSLRKMNGATLTLTQPSTFTGGVSIGGGTLAITADDQLGAAGASGLAPVTVATDYTPTVPSAAVLKVGGSYSTARQVHAGDGTIEVAAGEAVTMGAVTGTGALTKAGDGQLTVPTVSTAALSVSAGTLALVGGSGTSSVGAFSYAAGRLDVNDNRLVMAGTTPAAAAAALQAGCAGGTWDGAAGIVSRQAADTASDPLRLKAIGYATAAELGVTEWGTATGLTGAEVVTRLTYYGDIDLDGSVDADDYVKMDRAFAMTATLAAAWTTGDFDYSGVVDAGDYGLMDKAYVGQGGALSAELLADREARFGSDYVSQLVAAVPEPGVGGLLALAGAVSTVRRRRR